ncbi:MAG: ABC transporter ATP-binding protein [Phycisphaerales bacterium]|nr:ABC transporter ATP-binding protein [Phycisphaerales bacterium]
MESDVIQVENVSFAYGPSLVLSRASVKITQNDFACIIGPNGGGKTTLLKLMLGLLEPTEGNIRIFGMPTKQARNRIGYMPQHAQLDLQFPVSVLDVVLMGRLGHTTLGPYGRANRAKAREALETVGLRDLRSRPFSSLSGGQRQRVLIARALACEPDLLLLDEPTSNLDLGSQNDLYELLNNLNREMTVVLVSHDVAFVSKFVKTVVCVNRSVDMHPVKEIAGDFISEMYGRDMRMIMHEHAHNSGC